MRPDWRPNPRGCPATARHEVALAWPSPSAMGWRTNRSLSLVPNITNICYGRGVGYKIEEIELSKEIQEISATKIRAKMREEGKLK